MCEARIGSDAVGGRVWGAGWGQEGVGAAGVISGRGGEEALALGDKLLW